MVFYMNNYYDANALFEAGTKSIMNEHSKKFPDIKSYYDLGIWRSTTVKKAVKKGWITPAEYEEITGESYTA